jgi:hypothetical protein
MATHVADVYFGNSGFSGEEIGAKLLKAITIGCGKANSGDNDAARGGHWANFHQAVDGLDVKPANVFPLQSPTSLFLWLFDVETSGVFSVWRNCYGSSYPNHPR